MPGGRTPPLRSVMSIDPKNVPLFKGSSFAAESLFDMPNMMDSRSIVDPNNSSKRGRGRPPGSKNKNKPDDGSLQQPPQMLTFPSMSSIASRRNKKAEDKGSSNTDPAMNLKTEYASIMQDPVAQHNFL